MANCCLGGDLHFNRFCNKRRNLLFAIFSGWRLAWKDGTLEQYCPDHAFCHTCRKPLPFAPLKKGWHQASIVTYPPKRWEPELVSIYRWYCPTHNVTKEEVEKQGEEIKNYQRAKREKEENWRQEKALEQRKKALLLRDEFLAHMRKVAPTKVKELEFCLEEKDGSGLWSLHYESSHRWCRECKSRVSYYYFSLDGYGSAFCSVCGHEMVSSIND